MFVKPAPNPEKPGTALVVRFPRTGVALPPEGADVPGGTRDSYWERRLRAGDVVRAVPPSLEGARPAAVHDAPAEPHDAPAVDTEH